MERRCLDGWSFGMALLTFCTKTQKPEISGFWVFLLWRCKKWV